MLSRLHRQVCVPLSEFLTPAIPVFSTPVAPGSTTAIGLFSVNVGKVYNARYRHRAMMLREREIHRPLRKLILLKEVSEKLTKGYRSRALGLCDGPNQLEINLNVKWHDLCTPPRVQLFSPSRDPKGVTEEGQIKEWFSCNPTL